MLWKINLERTERRRRRRPKVVSRATADFIRQLKILTHYYLIENMFWRQTQDLYNFVHLVDFVGP